MHYSVLVIGPDVDRQLAPYHEFECTGIDDEFVQTLNVTEEIRKEYENPEHTVTCYTNPAGEIIQKHSNDEDPRFWRHLTPEESAELENKGVDRIFRLEGSIVTKLWPDGYYGAKKHYIPAEWTEVKIPIKDFVSFDHYAVEWEGFSVLLQDNPPQLESEHKYGWVRVKVVNGKAEVVEIVRRTNPNKKWDWYVPGGRWKETLILKPGCLALGAVTKPSTLAERKAGITYCISATVESIDWAQMKGQNSTHWRSVWQASREALAAAGLPANSTWEKCRVEGSEETRPNWVDQPPVQAILNYTGSKAVLRWLGTDVMDLLQLPEDEFVKLWDAFYSPTYALLKDGVWSEREYNWSRSLHQAEYIAWATKVRTAIESLPPGTPVTIVDYHN